MIKITRALLSYVCGGALFLSAAAVSHAAKPTLGGEPIQGPVYNSATNSYFQLYRFKRGGAAKWEIANIEAQRHRYKENTGRLAIVRDLKTLEFVRANFKIKNDTWIGLRFYCDFRKLIWVDGVVQSPAVSGVWHHQWYRNSSINCDRGLAKQYMPVYLTGPGQGGVHWQASGPAKVHHDYLVEYPAPKKSEEMSKNSNEMMVPAEASTAQ